MGLLTLSRFLKKLVQLREVVPARALPVITCLERLQAVKTGCFGWDLADDYRDRIISFTESVRKLQKYGQVRLEIMCTSVSKLQPCRDIATYRLNRPQGRTALFTLFSTDSVICKQIPRPYSCRLRSNHAEHVYWVFLCVTEAE